MEAAMKVEALPPAALTKLISLHADVQVAQAAAIDLAERIAKAEIIWRTDEPRDELAEAWPELAAAEKRFKTAAAIKSVVHVWLDQLPASTTVRMREINVALGQGQSVQETLTRTRQSIATAIKKRDRLQRAPVASADLARRIAAYVDRLAELARPLVTGIGEGETLDVRWPSKLEGLNRNNRSGYSAGEAHPLLLTALLHRQVLIDAITEEAARSVHAVCPVERRPARIAELTAAIERLGYEEEALIELARAEGTAIDRRVDADPRAILGVELVSEDERRADVSPVAILAVAVVAGTPAVAA
jgi:hypothetical protein